MADKVFIIDPNSPNNKPFGSSVITPENLSISVELTTIKKDRSAISVAKDRTQVKTGTKAIPITFIGGSPLGNSDGKNSLTTHYTEVNTSFNSENKDLETLGIKDINIEFNTSYAPLIVINFVDARGKLFEMGPNSPYSTFFELPYPIFELTIKGYYGKAVKYRLHLTNFNGKFDYSTGSFEIQCNFIGYTYAFLSDIIIGHLKGIPYTQRGATKVIEKKKGEQGSHLFLTFEELNEIVKNVDGKVNKLKQDNPQLRALKKSEDILLKLDAFKKSLSTNLNALGLARDIKLSSVDGFYPLKTNDLGFGQNAQDFSFTPQVNELQEEINNFNSVIKAELDILNGEGMLDAGYKLNDFNFLIDPNYTIYNKIVKDDFNGNQDSYILNVKGTDRYVEKLGEDRVKYDIFKDNVFTVTNVKSFVEFKVIDMSDGFAEIDSLVLKIRNEVNNTVPILGDLILNDSEIFTYNGNYFKPTIGNIVNLICDHVDIFMDCVRDVAVEAESNVEIRKSDLKGIGSNLDIVDGTLGNLKAFPSYTEIIDGVAIDKWIGNVAPNIPEVKFVEDLIEGIMKANKNDKETIQDLTTGLGETQWYPINTFDSIINDVQNPYKALKVDANVDDYMRLIMLRAIIYLGYSNRSVSIDDLTQMAILEANNVYNNIINNDIKAAIRSYANDAVSIRNRLISDSTTDKYPNIENGLPYLISFGGIAPAISNSAIIREYTTPSDTTYSAVSNKKYNYLYVSKITPDNRLDSDYSFIPLTTKTSYKDYNGNFLVKDGSTIYNDLDRIKLREEGVIFFSGLLNSRVSPDYLKTDDGATTIKILKNRSYVENKINYPSYGNVQNVATQVIDINNRTLNPGLSNNFFNVKFGKYDSISTSMLFYSSDNGLSSPTSLRGKGNSKLNVYNITNNSIVPTIYVFASEIINNRSKKNIVDVLVSGANLEGNSMPFVGFGTNSYGTSTPNIMDNDDTFNSLFGSDLYYSQDNLKAKAYLFLHTIPFDGLENKVNITGANAGLFTGSYIHKLFDQKGGFVEVPYSWVLFMGAVLSRLKGDFEVKFGNSNMSFIQSTSRSRFPEVNEYCISPRNNFFCLKNSETYVKVDDILLNLPESAKKEFIKAFDEWVNDGDFDKIRREFELFNDDDVTANQRYNYWFNFEAGMNNTTTLFNDPILNPKIRENYTVILKNRTGNLNGLNINQILNKIQTEDIGSPFNFFLEGKDKSNLVKQYFTFLSETRVIANSSWRTWVSDATPLDYPIAVRDRALEIYLDRFFNEFITLTKDDDLISSTKGDVVKENLFKSIDNDDIKLNLYTKIKSVYDKWICGEDEKYVGVDSDELYNSFRFIDRAYNNIEDIFKINLIPMVSQLTGNYNQNFYNYIARILMDNNFDFIPLPTFINYNNPIDVGDVFKPYTYNTAPEAFGPQFICMYIGERSNVLDYGGNFKNDGFDFGVNEPADFKSDSIDSESNRVPVFLVDYGNDQQSIFKDIQLNQSEFTATDESLTITDALSNSINSQGMGQNLFDVYNNRSYTAHIEALGNAMIQPLMHFQLNGVPIFHGAYTVIKVKHSIKPNTMTTSFSGVRIRLPKTKMVDDTTIFMNMFNGLDGIDIEGANLNDLANISNVRDGDVTQYSKFVQYRINQGKKPGLTSQGKEVEEYCIKEVGEYIEFVANLWYNQSYSKPYSNELYYNDLSKFGGGTLRGHKSHKKGTSIDIRQITTDKVVRRVEVGQPYYDQAATIKLIQLFVDSQSKVKGWKNNNALNVIYFDDPVVVAQFPNLVKSIGGHKNHMHFEFNIPDRVNESIANGDITSNYEPTMTGLLKKIDKGTLPTATQKIEFLGLIKT